MVKKTKPRVLFVYDIPDENYWKDGLWAALKLLEKDFNITWLNLRLSEIVPQKHGMYKGEFDFVLGWGAFMSPVDVFLRKVRETNKSVKMGLCIAGNAYPPYKTEDYNVLFYETNYYYLTSLIK